MKSFFKKMQLTVLPLMLLCTIVLASNTSEDFDRPSYEIETVELFFPDVHN
ncbi:MAG: hypothetical protein J6B96_05420 [Agathobacter sp.]|nr:hypothetical protein [Agathobacter sp.]